MCVYRIPSTGFVVAGVEYLKLGLTSTSRQILSLHSRVTFGETRPTVGDESQAHMCYDLLM